MRRVFCAALVIVSPIFCNQPKFEASNVTNIANEVFSKHLIHDCFSEKVAQKSLAKFIDSFDPYKIYFKTNEVSKFLSPSDGFLSSMVAGYDVCEFSSYDELNRLIVTVIQRARKFRAMTRTLLLGESAITLGIEKVSNPTFSKTDEDILKLHTQIMRNWLALYAKKIGKTNLDVEEKLNVIDFYERKRRSREDLYMDNSNRFFKNVLRAIVGSLDENTEFYDSENVSSDPAQSFCGFGIRLVEGVDGVFVKEILDGSPAFDSGVVTEGDVLIKINGDDVSCAQLSHINSKLSDNETVTFLLAKANGKSVDVDLSKRNILSKSGNIFVESEHFLNGMIGKIRINSLCDGDATSNELKGMIYEMATQSTLLGLVIDFRDVRQGHLLEAMRVAEIFIDGGTIAKTKFANGKIEYYARRCGPFFKYDGPLLFLISKNSSSLARAIVHGVRSRGLCVVVGDDEYMDVGPITEYQKVSCGTDQYAYRVTTGTCCSSADQSMELAHIKSDIYFPTTYSSTNSGTGEWLLSAEPKTIGKDIKNFLKINRCNTQWESMIPTLIHNSQTRLSQDSNFLAFQECLKDNKPSFEGNRELPSFGRQDLGVKEATEIVKDMIFLR